MEVRSVLLCFVIFIPFFGYTQRSAFIPELEVGITATQVHGDSYGGYDKLGAVGSFGVIRNNKNSFTYGLGIQLANKGSAKRANTKNGDFTTYTMNLWYAEVPLKFYYQNGKFLLNLGISAGALVYNKEKDVNGELNNQPEFNRFSLEGFGGIRYLVKPTFFVDLSIGNSLIPIRQVAGSERSVHLRQGGQINAWIFTKVGFRLFS